MLYFFIEIHMENQMNGGNQNNQQIGQNPVSQPIVSPEKPKTNYLLIGGIVLACFIVFGFGGYYLGRQTSNNSDQSGLPQSYSSPTTIVSSPTAENSAQPITTPDETANWSSYSNTKYNYTVKYPTGWEPNRGPGNISDEELKTQRDVDFYDPSLPGSDPGTGLNIRVNELDANGSISNCTDLNDCFSKTFNWLTETTTINKTSTSFLGQPAFTFTYQRKTDLYSQSWKYVFFIYKENVYNIHISTNVTREREIFELFGKILSTFKFV